MPRDPAYRAALDVLNEYGRAGETYDEFNSPHEGYAVLLEEVDELWDEIKNDKKPVLQSWHNRAIGRRESSFFLLAGPLVIHPFDSI